MTTSAPVRTHRLLLTLGAVLAVISIAVLWPLQQVGQICIMIYPAPPGCGADEPRWVPLVAIGLIVAAFAAMVVVYFTVSAPRTWLIVLCAVIVALALLAVAIVGISQTGIWDPYQPPIYID